MRVLIVLAALAISLASGNYFTAHYLALQLCWYPFKTIFYQVNHLLQVNSIAPKKDGTAHTKTPDSATNITNVMTASQKRGCAQTA